MLADLDPDVRHHQHDRRRGRAVSERDGKKPTGTHSRLPRARHHHPPPRPAGPSNLRRRRRRAAPRRHRAPAARRSRPGPPRRRKPRPRTRASSPCTVDGKEVVVKPGTNMIEAAKSVGVEIPYYCYHQRLSIAANCRMCLVEMSNAPGSSCRPARRRWPRAWSIKTDTPRVQDQQRAVLEFLLLNHPVDCSICDQAGECKLQDYYMQHDQQPSRLDGREGPEGQARGLGPHGGARPGALHPLHPLRALHARGGEGAAAGRVRPRERRASSTPSPASRSTATTRGTPSTSARWARCSTATSASAAGSGSCPRRRSVCTGCSRGCNTFLDF